MVVLNRKNYYATNKFRFEGSDWCGPGWSDGKWQSNRPGYATARSRFDQACKDHDIDIANGVPLEIADRRFFNSVDNPFVGAGPYISHYVTGQHKRKADSQLSYSTKKQIMEDVYVKTPRAGYLGRRAPRGPKRYHQPSYGGASTITKVGNGSKVRNFGSRKNVSFMYEYGGAEAEPAVAGETVSQILYAGVSTLNREKEALAIWCCIVKKLLEKGGTDIPNLDGPINFLTSPPNQLFMRIYVQEENGSGILIYTTPELNSVLAFAQNIVNYYETLNAQTLIFKEIKMLWGPVLDVPHATLNLERLVIHMHNNVHFVVQNNTPSADGLTTTDAIGTNPLKYSKYYIKQANLEIMGQPLEPDALVGVLNGGKADQTTQYFSFYSEDGNLTAITNRFLSDIPDARNVKNCKTVERGVIQPGAIVHSNVHFAPNFYLSTFYGRRKPDTQTAATGEYGRCIMFAFDKFIDSREENVAPKITWQAKHNLSCSISNKKLAPTQMYKVTEPVVYT